MTRHCPCCNQVLPEMRLGARFPNGVKARIFDIILRAGQDGVPVDALADITSIKRRSLHVHVAQINGLIEDAGYKIVGNARYSRGNYQLVRRQ